jgi:hypothetical protein
MTVNFRKIAVGTLTALAMLAVSPPAYSETQTGIVNVEVAVVCRDPRDLALPRNFVPTFKHEPTKPI